MNNLSKLNLTLDSNLGNLPLSEVAIEYNYIGKQLIKLFQQPLIPGVIITQNNHYQGMISRRIFFEFMSRPFSLGLFSERDIQSLYNILNPEVFMLMKEVLIVDAIPIILARDSEQIYEPIVVQSTTGNYRVLDIHHLLLAYSQIQASTLTELKEVKEESKFAKNNLQCLQTIYLETIKTEEFNTITLNRANLTKDMNNSANLLMGNIIHINRYVHDLLKLISLYQEFYPQPRVEIQQAIKKINFESISTEMPKLLTLIKNSARQIQQFVRALRNSVLN
jgi:hypothetical protein